MEVMDLQVRHGRLPRIRLYFSFARTARNSLRPAVFVKVPPKSKVNQRSISLRDLLGVLKTF